MEERRLLLAVALSLLVLTGYQMLFPPAPPRPRPSPGASAAPGPSPSAAAVDDPSPASPAPQAAPTASVMDDRERRVEVAGTEVEVALTNRGARLLSWRLLHFKDGRGRPEEMVDTAGAARALDIETGDPALDQRLRLALFRPSAEHVVIGAQGGEVSFEFAEGDVVARKALRFQPTGYLVAVSASVAVGGQERPVRLLWGPGLGHPTAAEMEVQGYQQPRAVALSSSGVERIEPKEGVQQAIAAARWLGVESQYFAAVFVAPEVARGEVRTVRVPAAAERVAPVLSVEVPPGQPLLMYVGPKDHATLARVGHGLAQVVDVGDWIGPIVVMLMGVLKWVQQHVGNYGWSIVVLTVLINVAMGPLRHYSIANGLKMARLAPEMKVIQDRYRKVPALDPRRQEMQKEVAELYARHGMSMGTQMAVGCVPLLLTMPFLLAFYRVLSVSIDLRGADFLWIPDLSHKDPLFITPILMAVTMAISTKMTPTTMDPAQQRMMMIMPLVLGVMFFAAPAGLNLYWLASNVCSIVQQGLTLRILNAAEERGERRRA